MVRYELGVVSFSVCVLLSVCSLGEPVELNSKFIRYSTFKTGKEQLVSSLHT